MPLCTACRTEQARRSEGTYDVFGRPETAPPHGMDWGEQCDRCGNVAGVTFGEESAPESSRVVVCGHNSIDVRTSDGDVATVLQCEIAAEDINDDGSISTPVSGECDCFPDDDRGRRSEAFEDLPEAVKGAENLQI